MLTFCVFTGKIICTRNSIIDVRERERERELYYYIEDWVPNRSIVAIIFDPLSPSQLVHTGCERSRAC